MTSSRILLVGLLIALSIVRSAGAADVPPTFRAPYLPARDSVVLQDVPAASDGAVMAMRTLRSQLDASPRDLDLALELAGVYVEFGRQVGDAHYAGYAEAVIAPWMSATRPPARALVMQATILQFRHQFAAARRLLDQALGSDPRNGQAWLTLATLDMVQGDYRAAGADCSEVTHAAGLVFGMACSGSLLAYTGGAHRALALLQQAENLSGASPPLHRAWIAGLIAEADERLGDWRAAESHYRAALALTPHDNFLLVAYADLLLDRERFAEVPPLLADHQQSDTAFLRIALAQAALRKPDAARYAWLMGARFEALSLRGEDYFGREQARFALELTHDAGLALDLARRNWEQQRAPPDARIFLEAALAAHQPHAARPVIEFVEKTRLEDPPIAALIARVRAAGAAGDEP